MKKVLVCGPFNELQKEKLAEAAKDAQLVFAEKDWVTRAHIGKVQAVIGNLSPELLMNQPHLEWVQLTSSGADAYSEEGLLSKDTVLTSATGAYGLGIAEYMIAFLLMMMKKIPAYLENQKQGLWRDEGKIDGLYGKRVLIVGMGNIGREFAKRLRPFGCSIYGIRRREIACPVELDGIYTMDKLEEELPKADVVALCIPGTKETYHLFDNHMLELCRPGAYLMNVGRGSVIDMNALAVQTARHKFGGVWLDVCEPEPLPYGHPLYTAPGVVLTPHIAGGFHLDTTVDNIYEICLNNLKAWQGECEYKSVVDRGTGYCR